MHGREELLLKVKVHKGGHLPMYHGDGECADLYTSEDVTMKPMEYRLIPLGVSIEIPEGYYAQILPRSSTAAEHSILMANSVGIIENTYCGDDDMWHFPAVAFGHTTIKAGTRICQFRLVKQEPQMVFLEVETFGNPNRGGLGSTGMN